MLTTLTTTAMLLAAVPDLDDPSGEASDRLSMAILGLLVLAGLIVVATLAFWRMTRPDRSDRGSGSDAVAG